MKVPKVSKIIPMNNRKKSKYTKDDFKKLYDKPPDGCA